MLTVRVAEAKHVTMHTGEEQEGRTSFHSVNYGNSISAGEHSAKECDVRPGPLLVTQVKHIQHDGNQQRDGAAHHQKCQDKHFDYCLRAVHQLVGGVS